MKRIVASLLAVAVLASIAASDTVAAPPDAVAKTGTISSGTVISGSGGDLGGDLGGQQDGHGKHCSAVSCATSLAAQRTGGVLDRFPSVRRIDPEYEFAPAGEADLSGDPPVPRPRPSPAPNSR